MHELVKGRLEEYLRGGGPFADVDEHLARCPSCRAEVAMMKQQSALFRSFSAPVDAEPAPGFYARVLSRVEAGSRPSVWNLFGDSAFGHRLAYASAAFLLLLGSLLFSTSAARTDDRLIANSPEYILAGQELPEPVTMETPERDRQVVLASLASYDLQDYE